MSFSSSPQVGVQQPVGPVTLYDKIWANHVIHTYGDGDGTSLVYIDRHLIHDASSPAAFDGLRKAGLPVRRPDCTLATADHGVPTTSRKAFKSLREYYGDDVRARALGEVLERNTHDFGVLSFGVTDKRQGIVHIVGPEQGFTLPGTICVCGDSHTATHGAFGCLAFGIGTSQVEQVLATQTLLQPKSKNMRITVDGTLSDGVTSKDVILHIIGVIGTAGGTGCVIEYAGSAIRSLSMEARMSMCNMSIEGGARAGMIAPDAVTFDYLRNRPLAPKGAEWEHAVAYWKTLTSDDGARFDREVVIRAEAIAPTVTWGTSPQDVVPITGCVPDPKSIADTVRRAEVERSLAYMGLAPNTPMEDIPVDRVFIGSCTNSRIEDLRAAAKIVLAAGPGAKIATGVVATVVPGSGLVKQRAEAEGLDVIFTRAGFEWREAGCSMCIALNGDKAAPRERCASTNNRNFEGRQGPGARTHLLSPAMAAAAAMTGKLTDVRKFGQAAAVEGGPKLSMKNENENEPLVDPLTLVPSPTSQETTAPVINRPKNTFKSRVPQFTVVKGIAVPLHIENVNTDLITTAEVCKTMKRGELGRGLLLPLRRNSTTGESLGFILDRPPYIEAKVLVCTGRNFGCGSSREKAVWAIQDFGIRCVIAPSFADIFRNNCFQCGVLPIELPVETCRELAQDAEMQNELEIDLERMEIRRTDIALPAVPFIVDTFRRECLLKGFDDIAMALVRVGAIEEYERIRREKWPWLDGTRYASGKPGPVSLSTVSGIEGW